MKTILSYILTSIHYFVFGLIITFFHPIQVICWTIIGYKAQKRSVDIMNYLIIKSHLIVGAKIKIEGIEKIPNGKPLIIISNHQSHWDVPPLVWVFRKNFPKFISKLELGKGIPSISYNLRKGGSALIDRKNRSQAIKEIIKLGRQIDTNNYSACIFPEGTRSKDGKVRRFKSGGLGTLLKTAPSAIIVPFAINGNYLLQGSGFAMGIGVKLTYTVLDHIERKDHSPEDIAELAEMEIKKELGQV